MKRFLFLPLLGLSACFVQDVSVSIYEGLWDNNVVTASDGIYISLPYAERLVRVNVDADSALALDLVDLDGARVNRLVPTPDGTS